MAQNQKTARTNKDGSPQKKRSGAKLTIAKGKDGGTYPCIVAWKANKRVGMINMIASKKTDKSSSGKKNTTTYQTQTGVTGEIWLCKITYNEGLYEKLFNGFYNPQTKKLRIPDINWVASCGAPNGGYFGKSVFKP